MSLPGNPDRPERGEGGWRFLRVFDRRCVAWRGTAMPLGERRLRPGRSSRTTDVVQVRQAVRSWSVELGFGPGRPDQDDHGSQRAGTQYASVWAAGGIVRFDQLQERPPPAVSASPSRIRGRGSPTFSWPFAMATLSGNGLRVLGLSGAKAARQRIRDRLSESARGRGSPSPSGNERPQCETASALPVTEPSQAGEARGGSRRVLAERAGLRTGSDAKQGLA